jgi:hypothetical protein
MRAEDDLAFREFARTRSVALRRTAYLLCGDWHLADPQPDGSVVLTEFLPSAKNIFAKGILMVTHNRTDGSRVSVTTSNDAKVTDGSRTTMPLSEQQAITLVTDPAFTVDG